MASKKISQLDPAGPLTGAELVEVVQGGQNVQTTTDDIADLGGGGPGAVDWGDIGGNLSDQTDLNTELTDLDNAITNHIADGTAAHAASAILFLPTGEIGSNNVQAAIAELDSEVDQRISAAIAGLKWKDAVRVATVVAGTLATSFENGDTVDGVVLATGNRILLKNQVDQTTNGIYIVQASGAPVRSNDADSASELEGAAVSVTEGSSNGNTTWNQTTDSITLGSSNIVWSQFGTSVPDADASTKGIAKLYPTPEGTNTDGAVSQAGINNVRHKSYVATASGTDTYTATVSPAISAVNSGDRFFIKFTNANTAASTLNLNTLGAIAIKKNGLDAIVPNDIKAGQISELVYDGTNFQLQSVATSSPTTFVTDKKRYYHGEWRVNRLINTSTGATSSDTSKDVTDFIAVEGSTEIVIFTTDGSSMTVYGWTYTSAFVAISEIRSNALIGTPLTTYTFTTPSNARYIQVYTRNGGTASETSIGWRAVMEIQTTADVTYKTPIIPEDYSGTARQKIQSAIDFARWTASPIVLNGLYLVDSAVIIRSNTKLIINGTVKLAVGGRDNIFRTESAEDPAVPLNRATRNIYISGNGGGGIAGSDETWGGYPATGVSGQSWRAIGLKLANAEHFTIEGIRVKSTNMWGIEMEQCRFGKVVNIDFDQDGRVTNQDGINIRRGSHDIIVENIIGITYDDIFACTNLGDTVGADLNVLGNTVFDPLATVLDSFNIIARNISTRQERLFTDFSPPHYGGGILLLCEEGRKLYNVTVDGVTNRKAHFYVGFTSLQYWTTTQCAYGDMFNINVSNVFSPIYIRRPLKDCSFTGCPKYDATNVNKSIAIPTGSQNVLRKYTSENFEYFTTMTTFVPTDLANLGMWFDANDSGSITHSSGLVSQWNDKSGNARHVTAATTARPLYSAAVGAGPNNKPGILFDGTTDALRRAKVTSFQGLSGITIFMVGGRPAGVPNGGSVVFHGFDPDNRTQLLNNYTDNLIYTVIAAGSTTAGTLQVGSQTLIRSTQIFDGTLSGNTNRSKLRVNGQAFTPTITGTVGTVTESHASSKFAIGTIDHASPVYIPGTVSEVIIYERALTSAEILQVEAYLEAKWAM